MDESKQYALYRCFADVMSNKPLPPITLRLLPEKSSYRLNRFFKKNASLHDRTEFILQTMIENGVDVALSGRLENDEYAIPIIPLLCNNMKLIAYATKEQLHKWRDLQGSTALHFAYIPDCSKYLINQCGIDVTLKNNKGQTAKEMLTQDVQGLENDIYRIRGDLIETIEYLKEQETLIAERKLMMEKGEGLKSQTRKQL